MNDKPTNTNTLEVLKKSLALFKKSDRKKLAWITAVQVFLSALDLMGVVIIGIISALAVNAITVGTPGNRLSSFLALLQIDALSPQLQASILAITATLILVLKTLTSLTLTKKSLYFVNLKAANLSTHLIRKFLNRPLQEIQQNTMYQSLYNLTTGVQAIGTGIIASAISMIADFALLVVLFVVLVLVDPIVAITSVSVFTLAGLLLFKLIHVRAQTIGRRTADLSVENNNSIIEIFEGFREAVVKNRRTFYADKIGIERINLAKLNAENAFLPQVSKYVLEIAIVLTGLLVSSLQFITNDAYRAVGVISIFMAASSRMGPAVLRIQQSAITFRTSLGMAQPTLQLIDDLKNVVELESSSEGVAEDAQFEHQGFVPDIVIENLTVGYPGKLNPAISDLSMVVKPGSVVALVGSSGAGKSTLVDCLLGILKPAKGSVLISGRDSLDAIRTWPGSIGYVPQQVFISRGTVLENVALGYDIAEVDETRVSDCLSRVQLLDYFQSLPDALQSKLGDFGSGMSGGQRQRLGIARALYTNPKLLILDEATSALDGQTESEVSKAIHDLKGQVTLILVAHRLSTVRSADQVHFLSAGRLVTSGTFEEVRAAVPEFDQQAKLMGL
jgi:ABC-type multidrug transport system fused ATPase/permease subunit